jgi:AcrR family transcriptional regulator
MVTTTRQPKARLAKPGGKRTAGVREHSAQQTRESILRAAIKVFAQHGCNLFNLHEK